MAHDALRDGQRQPRELYRGRSQRQEDQRHEERQRDHQSAPDVELREVVIHRVGAETAPGQGVGGHPDIGEPGAGHRESIDDNGCGAAALLSGQQGLEGVLGIGLVPERVEGYVLIELARIKPKQPLKPTSPAPAYYATEVGKIQVDTIRRRRRKGTATRDEEIAGLIGTGYEPNEATVIADNDNERLAKGTTGAEESLTAS